MPLNNYDFTEVPAPIFYERQLRKSMQSMYRAHYHNCHEIYYLVKGEINYFIDDKIYYIHSGDLVLIPKGILHKTLVISNPENERILINVCDELLTEDVKSCFKNYCYHIPPKYNKTITDMLQDIGEEYVNKDEFRNEMLQKKLYLFLVYLIRLSRKNPMIVYSALQDDHIEWAVQYIKEHFFEALTLQRIADHFFFSREYFSSVFKQKTGIGFNEYLNQVRISYAMKLLENSDITITDAAYKSGFNDSSYFTSVFKRICGISPKTYREKNKINTNAVNRKSKS